jgi:ABC-2 type transport system permease protein
VSASTYIRYEVLRTFRNLRFFIFSLVFPLILFLLIAGPNRHAHISVGLVRIPLPLYFMGGMTAFGSMMAVVSTGGRIAAERQIGWNRQLRLTPLRPGPYLLTKVACGYAMAAVSVGLISLAGVSLGVHLTLGQWLTTFGLVFVGLLPFAGMGIAIGHLVSVDSLGPVMGGATSILAMLGGAWGPIASGGFLRALSQAMPSYWLTQAGKSSLEGGWSAKGWLVVVIWSLAMARAAAWAYRRDTKKA